MNDRQRKFLNEYKKDQNATKAAIRAGYSEKTAEQQGCRLLKHPEIEDAIKTWRKEEYEKNTAERYEIAAFLTSVMRGEVVDNIPIFVGNGKQEFEEGKPSARDRLKAAELLGKLYAMFTEKTEVDGGKVVIINDIPRGDNNADG